MTLTTEHIARMPPPNPGALPHPTTIFRLTAGTQLRRVTGLRKKWKSSELSCSREIDVSRRGLRKRVWWPCGPAMEKFDNEIVAEIEGLLKNVDLGDADIYLRLYMIGRSPEASRPVIMVCCSNPRVRTQAEDAIRQSRVPEEYPEFALGASALPLEQPGLVRALAGTSSGKNKARSRPRPSRSHKRDEERDKDDEPPKSSTLDGEGINLALDLFETPRPVGRRIYLGSRHATGGAIIQVGSRVYQLTVSHVIDDDPVLSLSDFDNRFNDCHFDDMSEDDDEVDLHTSQESNKSPMTEPRPPYYPIPQSASIPRHLEYDSSHGPNPGLDYTLLPLDIVIPPYYGQLAFLPNSIILSDGRMVNIQGVAIIPTKEKEVVVAAGSCGVVHGVLLPTVVYLRNAKLPHFQRLYPVHLESSLRIGDSGSAVIDKTTGELFGHLVRGADQSTIAYMVAAAEVFEDIKQKTSSDIQFVNLIETPSSSHTTGGSQDIHKDPEDTTESLNHDAADLSSALNELSSPPPLELWDSYSDGINTPNPFSVRQFPDPTMNWTTGIDLDPIDDHLETPELTMVTNTGATTSVATSANSTALRKPVQNTGSTTAISSVPEPKDMTTPLDLVADPHFSSFREYDTGEYSNLYGPPVSGWQSAQVEEPEGGQDLGFPNPLEDPWGS
ncbi:uncharacterized protein B0H64DRAFT_410344 [Chaetomium fimeti]|uniref:Serine protease n=1 Tax=Chaetomium fimeti TaxID=1854472 RepID=A0AAE0LN45_9PEZI|nr:hypothetical protein B0H64DRAFT_410344 [Chaetomium fimeti]